MLFVVTRLGVLTKLRAVVADASLTDSSAKSVGTVPGSKYCDVTESPQPISGARFGAGQIAEPRPFLHAKLPVARLDNQRSPKLTLAC